MNRYQLWLIVLCLGFVIDLMLPILLGWQYPHYHHLLDTISTLGTNVSPVWLPARIGLISVGVLYSLFAFGQFQLFERKSRYESWYVAGILAFGLGSILAGIFPEDPKEVSVETVAAKIHGIASFIGFMLLMLCPIWANRIKQFQTETWINRFFFVAGVLSFALFLMSENQETGWLQFTGLFQRVNLVVLYAALLVNYLNLRPRLPKPN